jgi:hypothetical protein
LYSKGRMRGLASLVVVVAVSGAQASCSSDGRLPNATGSGANTGAGATAGTGAGATTGAGGTAGTGAGANAGAGGTGGGSAAPQTRVFVTSSSSTSIVPLPSPCDAAGACPDGQICFRLSAELAVCDIAQSPVRTTCSYITDECDCEGRRCAAGLVCVTLQESNHYYNTCVQPACTSPSDCGGAGGTGGSPGTGGSVCTPASLIARGVGRCSTPACRSDADCTGGVDGRCALVVEYNGGPRLERIGCVFAGTLADATAACAPAQPTPVRAPGSPQPYYTCGD